MTGETRVGPIVRLLVSIFVLAAVTSAAGSAQAQDHDAQPRGHAESQSTPRPLRLLMVDLSHAMSRITDGLWHDDLAMIAGGAHAIASHPRIVPEEMQSIRSTLGEQFEAFTMLDRVVHDAAVELAKAAEADDRPAVLDAHLRVRNGCIACHSTYRDAVRKALY